MIRAAVALVASLTFSAGVAVAQDAVPAVETPAAETTAADAPATEVPATEATAAVPAIDDPAWAETAALAEAISEAGRGSAFALARVRGDLVAWRDTFSAAQSANASRIATTEAQIAALGPVPAEGEPAEDARVADRRTALMAELARLRAPGVLAYEAYVHADGLIGEIDTLARGRRTSALLTRATPPLDPRTWPEASHAVTSRLTGLWKEVTVSIQSDARAATFARQWPLALLWLVGAAVVLTRGRTWLRRLGARVVAGPVRAGLRGPHGVAVWNFALAVGLAILPILGLLALSRALTTTGFIGLRTSTLIEAVPVAGSFVLIAGLLAGQFFAPTRSNPAPFDFDARASRRGARCLRQGGWILAAAVAIRAYLAPGDVEPAVEAQLLLPVEILLAVVLFRFGRLLARTGTPPSSPPEADAVRFRRRLLAWVGQAVAIVAVVAPLLSILGFYRAGGALLMPTVLTLALGALLILVQWLVTDLYALATRREDGIRDALLPVLAGFAVVLAALPLLALVWGASVDDLSEVWTRFREGFQVGETRLSPANLFTFGLVFTIGYLLTRLVQGTLRSTVLPKTRIDPGAQNAIVAGLGYVGLFLAALLAVTTAGLDLSNLAIVAGALSVGIGFGLQNIVSNFVAGIILLIERPISEGDWIEVGPRMGYVRDISVRSTRIETFDRTDVIIPNADLVSGQVVNWTRGNLVGRIILPVSVVAESDADQVAAILREIAEAHPMVLLSPPPAVVLAGFGADALNFEIRAVIRDVNFGLSARSEMNRSIARRFLDAGIRTAGTPAPAPAAPPKPVVLAV